MKKVALTIIISLSLLALLLRFASQPLNDFINQQAKAGLKVISKPEAAVFIDGNEVGRTPYQNDILKSGEYLVKVAEGENVWQGRVKLARGTVSVINRELGANSASSSGEVLTLNFGSGVVITSSPSQSEVEIDGKVYGDTPISVSNLSVGEHTFLISHNGYLKRSIRASVPKGFSLYINIDLALTEIDLSALPVPTSAPIKKAIVKPTSTGFLRVRSKPSLQGDEIGKVSSGESLILVEELSGWSKIRMSDGQEGYVSSSYIKKETK